LALTGCEFSVAGESTELYEGEPVSKSTPWESGQNLIIDGLNGKIEVVRGEAGKVSATFEPSTLRGADEDAEADAEMKELLALRVEEDSSGNVLVKTSKSGGSSSLGARITVRLPPEFNGGLRVDQRNGDVLLKHVGSAESLQITNSGTGFCKVAGAPSIKVTEIRCGWDVEVLNVADKVSVSSDNTLGATVRVGWAELSASAGDSSVSLDSGDIELLLPKDAEYTLQAQGQNGGVVAFDPLPTGCTADEASSASKSLRCGSATEVPRVSVRAGLDEKYRGRVAVRFE
jgi:hypothetical protein